MYALTCLNLLLIMSQGYVNCIVRSYVSAFQTAKAFLITEICAVRFSALQISNE